MPDFMIIGTNDNNVMMGGGGGGGACRLNDFLFHFQDNYADQLNEVITSNLKSS